MTALLHTIPRDLLNGIQTGDEGVLENGFREIFPVLASEAADEVDDVSSVGRVVEQAFLRVLDGRTGIETAADLDAALQMAMHDAAARENSRLAALRRFERNEGVATRRTSRLVVTDAGAGRAWEHIQNALHRTASDAVRSHARANTAAKHRAAVHVAEAIARRNKWTIPAIVLGTLIMCAGAYGLIGIDSRPTEQDVLRALSATDARTFFAGDGRIGNLTLADETTVRLGAGSKLRLSTDFGEPLRALWLSGTASFIVAPGQQPLEIRADGIALSATDGQVDVRADSLAPKLVRVNRGLVTVRIGDSSWTAAAGEAFVVETSGRIRAPADIELQEGLGWIDGRFAASGSVADVIMNIRRWYGADILVGDASIIDRQAEVVGSLDSLASTIASLERSARLRMIWVADEMVLFRR